MLTIKWLFNKCLHRCCTRGTAIVLCTLNVVMECTYAAIIDRFSVAPVTPMVISQVLIYGHCNTYIVIFENFLLKERVFSLRIITLC